MRQLHFLTFLLLQFLFLFCFFVSSLCFSDKKLSFSCVKYIKKPIILNYFKNIVRKPKNYWLLRNITCLKYRRYTRQILSSNVVAKEIVWYETSRLNRITLGNVSCSLTRLRRSHAQKGEVLLGDTNLAWKTLRHNLLGQDHAALPKVELISRSRNGSGINNAAWNV